jgi:hypothetical protein
MSRRRLLRAADRRRRPLRALTPGRVLDTRGSTKPAAGSTTDGKVSLFTENGTHLVADVAGYFTDSTAKLGTDGLFVPQSPDRFLDTRPGTKPAANSTTDLTIAGVRGVPASAVAAALNVTLANTTNPGFTEAGTHFIVDISGYYTG